LLPPKACCSAGLDLAPFLVDRHADELAARRRPLLVRWAQLEMFRMRLMATSSVM
jgi:hypothetical protein